MTGKESDIRMTNIASDALIVGAGPTMLRADLRQVPGAAPFLQTLITPQWRIEETLRQKLGQLGVY
jgi:hypothetical protein